MTSTCRRDLKNKPKTTQKAVTVKEMFLNKKTSKISNDENQNESYIEVFRSYGAKSKKPSSSQSKHSQILQNTEEYSESSSDSKHKLESTTSRDNVSKSDDSFDELFADFKPNLKQRVEPLLAPEPEDKDFSEILRDNLSPCCPMCFKKNIFDDVGLYINHLKFCAYKNKVSTEQLKKALELQHKQASERLALGLPLAPKEKPKKSYPKKGPMDSNLELGIALSESLRESEIMNKIQEKETLIEAGIEPEILSQYRHLEDFGFATTKPVESTSYRGYKRPKNARNYLLFTRTQEERERIIAEKVAMILDCDSDQFPKSSAICDPYVPISKYLIRFKDDKITLWRKSFQSEEETDQSYYVPQLSGFISPCKVPAGAKLRHLSQIPGRSPSPVRQKIFKNFQSDISLPKSPFIKKLNKTEHSKSKNVDSRFCQNWRYMLNKDILSDIIIYAKNEIPIYAHKLVFYARCRSILSETIEEVENDKKKEILMWMEYSSEAIMILLEYIYTGVLPPLSYLDDINRNDLRALSQRYGFKDIVEAVDTSQEAQLFAINEEDSNFENTCKSFEPLIENPQTSSTNEGEKNLQMMLEALQTQNLRSPEMFEDEEPIEVPSQAENLERSVVEDILSTLCSPVHSSPTIDEPFTQRFENLAKRDKSSSPTSEPLTQNFEIDAKSIEKRKSYSPLSKDNFKKSRISDSETPSKLLLKKTPRKILSQVVTISDNSEASDCDDKNNPSCSLLSNDEEQPIEDQIPHVSSVWDGFEDLNYDVGYSPINKSYNNTPKITRDSLFGSFSIDEDVLNKIENNAVAAATQKPTSVVTPDSVRKFKRRSKSENCITPVNKLIASSVTPMADYSTMKGDDLKKELEKYGIKPGLSRNKAKMMLRYIYEQLHPFEDEINTADNNSIKNKVTNTNQPATSNIDSYDSSDSDTSGVSLLEENYVDEPLEMCSQDVDNKSKVSIDTAFNNVLREHKTLHQKILLYEPVWLESLKATLKEYGARCSKNELMNYLDEKCITFRSQQHQTRHRRKTKKATLKSQTSKRTDSSS